MNLLKRNNKKSILTLIFITFLVVSCEKDNSVLEVEKTTITTGKITFIKNTQSAKNTNPKKHTLEFKMNSNIYIPKFEKEEDFRAYLVENKNIINGSFVIEVDGSEIYKSEIVNGVEVTEEKERWSKTDSKSSSYPCTFKGLSKCTQDSIQEMSFFGKAVCIFAGPHCVFIEFTDCGWKNCGGEEWIKENTNL
jgi:hypothetical protein